MNRRGSQPRLWPGAWAAGVLPQAWAQPAPLLMYCGICKVRPITELLRKVLVLALSLKRSEADVTLSWRATAFFPKNAFALEAVDLSAGS